MAATETATAPQAEVVDAPREYNPLALIDRAIERGMDANQLGKLMDLQERWTKQQAKQAYAAAMSACQREMPVVVRDATNSHTNSRYAKLENVHSMIRPVYTKHGFSLSFGTEKPEIPDHVRVFCDVGHEAGHVERFFGDFPLDGAGFKGAANKTGIQATGSTYSYARRYLTLMAFNVAVANEDGDGNDAGTITAEHVSMVANLFEATKKLDPSIDWGKFLKWLGVERVEDMNAKQFATGMADLNLRRKEAATKKGGGA